MYNLLSILVNAIQKYMIKSDSAAELISLTQARISHRHWYLGTSQKKSEVKQYPYVYDYVGFFQAEISRVRGHYDLGYENWY